MHFLPLSDHEQVQGDEAARRWNLWISVEGDQQAVWGSGESLPRLLPLQSLTADGRPSPQMAIKKMKKKFYSWEECMQLREIKVSRCAPCDALTPAPLRRA